MANMFFSIIVPVYDTEKYLPRALNSIANQTFDTEKIEVIVVNDGSPNILDYNKIIKEYSDILNITDIKKEKNEGLYLARKTGIMQATGKYILHLDADDILVDTACALLEKKAFGEVDYIKYNHYSVPQGLNASYEHIYAKKTQQYTKFKDIILDIILHALWNKCYNTKFLQSVYSELPDFYASFAEDYFQTCIIEYKAKTRMYLDDALYIYHMNCGITNGKKFNNLESVKLMVKSISNIHKHMTAFLIRETESKYLEYLDSVINTYFKNIISSTASLEVKIFIILNVLTPEPLRCLTKLIDKSRVILILAKITEKPINMLAFLKHKLLKR